MTTGKFAGLLNGRKTPATSEPIEESQQPTDEYTRPPATAVSPRAKLAKTKDPNRKNFGFRLKIDTNTEAVYYLRKMKNGQDMSDLVEQLLTEWIATQERAAR